MQKLLIGAGLLLVAAGYWLNRPAEMPSSVLDQYRGERRITQSARVGGNCPEHRCLVVYVAPWCSSCKVLTPTINSLARELKSEGVPVAIVIGHDKLAAVKAYAKDYSEPIYDDSGGEFYRAIGIRGVPFFAITDSNGKIKTTYSGGYSNVAKMRTALKI